MGPLRVQPEREGAARRRAFGEAVLHIVHERHDVGHTIGPPAEAIRQRGQIGQRVRGMRAAFAAEVGDPGPLLHMKRPTFGGVGLSQREEFRKIAKIAKTIAGRGKGDAARNPEPATEIDRAMGWRRRGKGIKIVPKLGAR
jgi:hypothetical protein